MTEVHDLQVSLPVLCRVHPYKGRVHTGGEPLPNVRVGYLVEPQRIARRPDERGVRVVTSVVVGHWGDRIREQRKRLGISQTELAAACGIKQPSVSAWESGDSLMIDGVNLVAVARKLRVTPEWVMTGRDPSPASHSLELDLDMLKSAIVAVKEALRAFGLELDAFVAAPMIAFAYRERQRLPRHMTKEGYRDFDAMVTDRLRGELGHGEEARSVARGGTRGTKAAEAGPKKARAGR